MQYYFSTRNEMIAAIAKPGFRIAEIGVWLGEFADVLLQTKPSELVLIDPWTGKVSSGDVDGLNVRIADLDAAFPLIVEKYKGAPLVKIERGFSYNVLQKYPDNYFDLIYIDGDHSFEGCLADLELAFKKVKSNGWIAFHDYGHNLCKAKNIYKFGVDMAVDNFCIRYNQKIIALGLDGMVSGAIRVQKPSS